MDITICTTLRCTINCITLHCTINCIIRHCIIRHCIHCITVINAIECNYGITIGFQTSYFEYRLFERDCFVPQKHE